MKCVLCGTSRMKAHFLANMVLCLGCGHVQRGQIDDSPPSPEISMPSLQELTLEQLTAQIEALLTPPVVELPSDPVKRIQVQAALRLNPPPVDQARLDALMAELQARQAPKPAAIPDPDLPGESLDAAWFTSRWEDFSVRMVQWLEDERSARFDAERREEARHAELLGKLDQLIAIGTDAAQVLVQEVTGLRRIGSVGVAILSEGASPGVLAKFGLAKEQEPAADPQLDNQAPAPATVPQLDNQAPAPATVPQLDNQAPAPAAKRPR